MGQAGPEHAAADAAAHAAPDHGYTYQSSNDLGHHRFVYAVAGHAGDWRQGRLPLRAAQLNQPLVAFQTDAHDGPLGHSFSMASLDDTTGQIAIMRAEARRGQRRDRRPAAGALRPAWARHAPDGVGHRGGARDQRRRGAGGVPIDLHRRQRPGDRGPAPRCRSTFTPYQPRTIALTLAPRDAPPPARQSASLPLPFNLDGITSDHDRRTATSTASTTRSPRNSCRMTLHLDGVDFTLGPTGSARRTCSCQPVRRSRFPPATFSRAWIVAAAVGGDVPTTSRAARMTVREWQGPVGQWWSRLKAPSALWEPFVPAVHEGNSVPTTPSQREIQDGLVVRWDPTTGNVKGIDDLRPSFAKRDEIAWVGSHRHAPEGNEIYVASYLFLYGIDLPAGARELRLPSDKRLRILAVSVAREPKPVEPAQVLYVPEIPSKR